MRYVWALIVVLVVVSATGPAAAVPPPPGSTVLIVGDSVPYGLTRLAGRFHEALGWWTVDVSRVGCSVFGQQTAWRDGTAKREYEWCESVRATQDAALAEAPEVVVWWDRLALIHYFTGPGDEGGEFVRAGSERFWELRLAELRARASEIVATGAILVLVRTEPMGMGVSRPCPTWHASRQCWDTLRFRTNHYRDITRRWNANLKGWVAHHPGQAFYVSVTERMCRADVSPCDDRIRGVPARDDGSHYRGAGDLKVSRVLVRQIREALA